ncbi:MAG: hypothetical protein AABZ34_19075 [Nitrospirota bacterium]
MRRPELEKDNPTAPQLYVGPRRRRALSRATTPSHAPAQDAIAATMQALTAAAEEFVSGVPYMQDLDKERNALLAAIAQTQTLLATEHVTVTRAARTSKRR